MTHDIRCPRCKRLLMRVEGVALIETVCPKCKANVRWPVLEAEAVLTFQTGDDAVVDMYNNAFK